MDAKRPIADCIGNDYVGFDLFRFATGMFIESTVTRSETRRFNAFANATARLRPRYRDGYTQARGHGHRV